MRDTLAQLFKFGLANKKLWLFPFMLILILLGAFLIVVQNSVVAPLIYAIF